MGNKKGQPNVAKQALIREQQNAFINELMRNNYNISKTCRKVKMHNSMYYKWMEDPAFKKVMEKLRDREVDNFEDAFRDLVEERNPQAVIFGLKTRGKHRGYVERTEVAHFGASEIKIVIEEGSNKRTENVVDAEVVEAKDDGKGN